jgi:hypothetical protein
MELGGLSVRDALLPTPREDAEPLAREGSHRGLRGLPLVTLLLVIEPRPEGGPERCSRPLHKRLAEACGALEAPVAPALLAAAFGDRREAGVRLERGGGGLTCALLATGDQEAGSADGSGTWEGWEEGKVRMALGAWGDSGVKSRAGVPGDTELAEEGLDEQGLGSAAALSGGPGRVAALRARIRVSMTSVERTGGSRQQVSQGERRARGAALRGGQRLRKSQKTRVSCSCNPGSP